MAIIHRNAALLVLCFHYLVPVTGFVVLRSPLVRTSRLDWMASSSDSSSPFYDKINLDSHDTLLRVHLAPQKENALDQVQRFIQTFPYAVVLLMQPLVSLPTSDGGVELKFFQSSKHGPPEMNGGIRLFLLLQDNNIILTVKRNNADGQVCEKLKEEKEIVTKLLAGLAGRDCGIIELQPQQQCLVNAVRIESIYHKWMLDDIVQSGRATIFDEA
jgi:hypothetical protein